jgi:hypothetical protein
MLRCGALKRTLGIFLVFACGPAPEPPPKVDRSSLVQATYGPFHPGDDVPITFAVTATQAVPITGIELYVFHEELRLIDGSPEPSNRTGGLQESWTIAPPATEIFRQHRASGFGPQSLVTFEFQLTLEDGRVVKDGASFAAGAWPWSDRPIPLWINGPPDRSIDIAFVPDEQFGDDPGPMLVGLRDILFRGYHRNNLVQETKRAWQFYYFVETGTITFEVQELELPDSALESPIIDVAGIVHTRPGRDFATGPIFSTDFDPATAVHESGHAVLGLADEYDGGGHHYSSPHPNNFASEGQCRAYNEAYGRRTIAGGSKAGGFPNLARRGVSCRAPVASSISVGPASSEVEGRSDDSVHLRVASCGGPGAPPAARRVSRCRAPRSTPTPTASAARPARTAAPKACRRRGPRGRWDR